MEPDPASLQANAGSDQAIHAKGEAGAPPRPDSAPPGERLKENRPLEWAAGCEVQARLCFTHVHTVFRYW